jgi:hypothetical protein
MLVIAIMPVTRSKFALLVAVAWATLFAAAGQAAVSGDFAGLIDIGRGRKMYLECRGLGFPTVCRRTAGRAQLWPLHFAETGGLPSRMRGLVRRERDQFRGRAVSHLILPGLWLWSPSSHLPARPGMTAA